MSYEIDRTDKINYGSIVVADQSVNQETSLDFVGKNYYKENCSTYNWSDR